MVRLTIFSSLPTSALTLIHVIANLLREQRVLTADPNEADIIDETLDLFRANSLFRNFEIKGGADRLLIVLILFVSDCLAKIQATTQKAGANKSPPTEIEAGKLLNTLAVEQFPLPGEAGFPLNAHYQAPASRVDSGELVLV